MQRIIVFVLLLFNLVACGLLDGGPKPVFSTIQYHVIKDSTFTSETIFIQELNTYVGNGFKGKLDSNASVGSFAWSSREWYTDDKDVLSLKFVLRTESKDTISTGNISIPLKKEWAWSVYIWKAPTNPLDECFDCVSSKSFKILDDRYVSSETDSIFIIYGGKLISK